MKRIPLIAMVSIFATTVSCRTGAGWRTDRLDWVPAKTAVTRHRPSKKGACSGHNGLKEWYADETPGAVTTGTTSTPTVAGAGGLDDPQHGSGRYERCARPPRAE